MQLVFRNALRLMPIMMSGMVLSIPSSYSMPRCSNHFSFSTISPPSNHTLAFRSDFKGDGFYMEQQFVGCLAIYSYYIESDKQAFLIDPQNDISSFVDLIAKRGTKLAGVFLSHYHADYLAGHAQLQARYGCPVYMGPKALATKGTRVLADRDFIKLGSISLEVIHTPGHTEESSCLLLRDAKGKQQALLTGDTLFLNEVGRPDLAAKTNLTARDLASLLFQSLKKLKFVEDSVRIYPGHGSGSACGKSIGAGDYCTFGTQRQNNYALKINKEEQFLNKVLQQMPEPPKYFGYNVKLNKFEPFSYQDAFKRANVLLSPQKVAQNLKNDSETIVIDVRQRKFLAGGIIEGALCFGIDGAFATWIGTLLSPDTKLIIYGAGNDAIESIQRLLRIGYINIVGHANFPIEEWVKLGYSHDKTAFADNVAEPGWKILDVRKPAEWSLGCIKGDVVRLELGQAFKNISQLPKNDKYIIHCKSGYRASIAYSWLRRNNITCSFYPNSLDELIAKGAKLDK